MRGNLITTKKIKQCNDKAIISLSIPCLQNCEFESVMVGNKHTFQKLKSIPTAYDDANNNEEENYVYEKIAKGKKLKCLQKTQWFLHFW